MFETAIERASKFTRAIHTITRTYESEVVHPGAATLFFINAEGWALTCKHVAELVVASDGVNTKYGQFKNEIQRLVGSGKKEKLAKREAQKTFNFYDGTMVQIKNSFVDCIDGNLSAELRLHQSLDLALIHFQNCRILITEFPVFPRDTGLFKVGKFICRLGYPFPEFNNFEYSRTDDDVKWTTTGIQGTPRFPIEGMVTRMIANPGLPTTIVGFETSTPGLRGQSGGPAFDADGRVWGVQSATRHLHLGFDVKQQIYINGKQETAKDHAFLHVGNCIHIDAVKEFMRANGVSFQEG